jgi:hypothetical protein
MDLEQPGWLGELLERILAGYLPERARARLSSFVRGEGTAPAPPAVRARAHLDRELRRSGLLYGSPKLPARVAAGRRLDRAEALFFAVVSGECFLALDVARIFDVPFERNTAEAELTMFLAAATGRPDLADEVHHRALSGAQLPIDRLQEQIERALRERVALVTGETSFDLPLHNGIVFGEARTIGRLALDWYGRNRFRPELARRLYRARATSRAALLQAILGLSSRLHPVGEETKRAVNRELGKLGLPRPLVRQVRAALARPPKPAELSRRIRSRTMRRFILEQVHLAAIVDGRVDEEEAAYLRELAATFEIDAAEVAAIEAEVADYFADPDDVLDAFEVLGAGQAVSMALVDRIAVELADNWDRIQMELKETGELGLLLGKVARGGRLTPEERAKAREQLLDVAKVVPQLAIIAAPGGMILFAALLKVLPVSFLPSSFDPERHPPAHRIPRRRRTVARSR